MPRRPRLKPCEVCGEPTASKMGVCRQTSACEREWTSRRYANTAPEDGKPCDVCGRLTKSIHGVCQSTLACSRELQRRKHRPKPRELKGDPCAMCGVPTVSKWGVCERSNACRVERNRRMYPRKYQEGDYAPCDVCGAPTRSPLGVCLKGTPECNREYGRRYRAAFPERRSAEHRRYYQRTDRPCRYTKAGCAELAQVGKASCPEHQRADDRRRRRWRRTQVAGLLAAEQGGVCAWCGEPLSEDLARTEVDHIIPIASGIIIDDDWNLQLLHKACNASKMDQITPRALALAVEHGIVLMEEAA